MDVREEYNAIIDGVIERLESLRDAGVEYVPKAACVAPVKAALFIIRELAPEAGTQADNVLTYMLTAMGLSRDTVYITQADKSGQQARADKPGLDEEIAGVSPQVIVLLGPKAAKILLGSEDIATLRGRFHDYNGIKVMPSYDPASIVGRTDLRLETWADMQMVMRELADGEDER